MARKKKYGEVWWLAHGHSRRSRQPSFAPLTARPVVSTSSYGFGWHRQRQCFVTSENHDILMPNRIRDYHCDPDVASRILRRCAYKNVLTRFFDNPFAKEDDIDIFAAAGYMFGITLRKRYWGASYNTDAEANLHFYAPNGRLQTISLHNGMTRSFARIISGMKMTDIQHCMQ